MIIFGIPYLGERPEARKAPRLQGWWICCTVCLGKLRVSTRENYWPKMSPTQGSKWPSRCLDWVHFLWWRGSCIFYEDQYNHNLDQREGIEKVHQSASNKILFKLDLNQFSLQNFQNETSTTNQTRRRYEIECELRRALGLYILTLFWEVQMHYLFVYFLSELNMYSDTGVG